MNKIKAIFKTLYFVNKAIITNKQYLFIDSKKTITNCNNLYFAFFIIELTKIANRVKTEQDLINQAKEIINKH